MEYRKSTIYLIFAAVVVFSSCGRQLHIESEVNFEGEFSTTDTDLSANEDSIDSAVPDSIIIEFSDGFKGIIDSLILSAGRDASWSVEIRTQDSIIYQFDSERNLLPASNLKLFTTAAALKYLGGGYRISSDFSTDGMVDSDGILKGNLYIQGNGNPCFSERFSVKNGGDAFQVISDKLKETGIDEIGGDIIVIDTLFNGPGVPASWEWGDLRFSFASSGGDFCYNENYITVNLKVDKNKVKIKLLPELPGFSAVDNFEIIEGGDSTSKEWIWWEWENDSSIVFSGKVTKNTTKSMKASVPNPTLYALRALEASMKKNGIKWRGDRIVTKTDSSMADSLMVLFSVDSAPVREIVKIVNTYSVNFFAEQVLKLCGLQMEGKFSNSAGLKAIDRILKEAGVETDKVNIADGCGLSRRNFVSAGCICALLEYCSLQDFYGDYKNSLAQYGNGTLQSRFPQWGDFGDVDGVLYAKTGSLTGIRAFSGYLELNPEAREISGKYEPMKDEFEKGDAYFEENISKEPVIFSIICNNYSCDEDEVEDTMDKIIGLVYENMKPAVHQVH